MLSRALLTEFRFENAMESWLWDGVGGVLGYPRTGDMASGVGGQLHLRLV
jgi:hypothetical protein